MIAEKMQLYLEIVLNKRAPMPNAQINLGVNVRFRAIAQS
jgi:hypothetical protein